MKGKTWLWIALGALTLVGVCCIGVMIGGALARRNPAATRPVADAVGRPVEDQPVSPVAEQPTDTSLPATPTAIPTGLPPATESPSVAVPPTQPPSTPLPTPTPFPTPPPPAAPPVAPPAGSDLQALVDYADALKPLLDEAGIVVQRDGEILEAADGGNDAVLCDGRLAADNETMAGIASRVRAIHPPADAARIHDLLLRSGDAWTEALDNVRQFCDTGNQLFKIPAVLKFWEAAANLQDAANRFWLLLVAKGVEDWVQH
jgi:hypothetical protein